MQLFWRRKEEPCPPGEETEAAYGSNWPQPVPRLLDKSKQIQAPAKQQYSSQQQPACAAIHAPAQSKRKKSDRVDELVKDSLIPNLDHSARFESRSQAVRAKRSQCDRQETKRSRDSKKQHRHPVSMA